jgi:hypothetical protein
VDLLQLFPNEDYEFRMSVRRGDAAEFFCPTAEHEAIVAERRHWLAEEPHTYAALQPGGDSLLAEALECCRAWSVFSENEEQAIASAGEAWEQLLEIGRSLEADFLLLGLDAAGELRLRVGCVCFPSSWSLPEKMGETMRTIHGPAPGLNASLGAQVDKFLTRLQVGIGFLRHNWGLSASAERNQHPSRATPRLGSDGVLESAWLRVEWQALVALPRSGGVLFGIRIDSRRLSEVKSSHPEAAVRLARALRTMPPEIASYKGIAAARLPLAEQLER